MNTCRCCGKTWPAQTVHVCAAWRLPKAVRDAKKRATAALTRKEGC